MSDDVLCAVDVGLAVSLSTRRVVTAAPLPVRVAALAGRLARLEAGLREFARELDAQLAAGAARARATQQLMTEPRFAHLFRASPG